MSTVIVAWAAIIGTVILIGLALVIGWSMGYDKGKQRQRQRIENLCDATVAYAAECYELRAQLLAMEIDDAFRDVS